MPGLSVNDVVSVIIQMSPVASPLRNFGSLLIIGDSDPIDTQQRYRLYTSLTAIGTDFGTTAPEYQAALLFFSQSPAPAQCYVGRWASGNTRGRLVGGALNASAQQISNFTGVLNGGVNFTIDGSARNLSGLNFSGQTNLNGVASVIQGAFAGSATVTWNSVYNRFEVKSSSAGSSSAVSFAAPGSGVDISSLLGLTSTQGGYSVGGIQAETIVSCVSTFVGLTNAWYGLQIAATAAVSDADYVNVASTIEATGSSGSRILGVTTQESAALLSTSTADLAALLQAGGYTRTFCQYSSSNAYASASIFGRAFSVNFQGSNTTITLKFKQEPVIVAETLTETQAAALDAKNCNYFVNFNNNTAIIQQGKMAGGFFFDEVHGTDWLQNQLQTDVYNLLYTSPTKIPQTDAGINQIATVVTQDLQLAVNNGFVAPGVWTGPPIGALVTGQFLSTGYYVFQPPIATQAASDRQARKAPPIQAAIKLAGAIHFSSIIVAVNRAIFLGAILAAMSQWSLGYIGC
jgi:hypothetical protein